MLGQDNDQIIKQDRYYLRFHNCISRAIELNQQIFGNRVGKDGKQPCFEHSLRVAGFSEEILDQTMEHYHLTWLLGILHDNKEQNPLLFSEKIDFVLQDLFPNQRQLMKKYIEMLTSDKTLSKGDQKGQQLKKIQKMDLVPTWVLLFDKYDNCRRFKANGCGKSKKELDGYFSVAYVIYIKAKNRHKEVKQFIPTVIKEFYEKMGVDLGGEGKAVSNAKEYCESF